MDADRFDTLARALAAPASRRRVLRGLALAGVAAGPAADAATAKKRRKKVKRNSFGCVDVGRFCRRAGQCCSGICTGKKGKKTCKGHDAGVGCQAGLQELECSGTDTSCMSATGTPGVCATTTGNAGYCHSSGLPCTTCHKDADCQELCQLATAACTMCPDCDGGDLQTACVGPSPGDCP
jgi:hypothetical protein